MPMFTVVLVTLARIWNQPTYPKCGTYTMTCYSAIKENEILSFAEKWRELRENEKKKKSRHRKTNHMFSSDS